MRKFRVYTPQSLSSVDRAELSGPVSHYLSRVLRLSSGDAVTLFNGDGYDYSGEIAAIERQCVQVRLDSRRNPGTESPLKITLVQAISRGERMDYCLQKATELGVFCIQPVTSRRVEVHLDEKRRAKRLAHWQAVVVSACEQSGRAVVPEVKPPLSLGEWMAVTDVNPRLVLDPTADTRLSSVSTLNGVVSIVAGPEGGLNGKEMEQAQQMGVTPVSLGPRVLRTETAGPAAIAILQATSGDL